MVGGRREGWMESGEVGSMKMMNSVKSSVKGGEGECAGRGRGV